MSRSNGPGAPPNGWPAEQPQSDGQNPYKDPYYAAPQQRPPQAPPSPARNARIQTAPPSRIPQPGLPPGGVPQQAYAPPAQAYGQQSYAPPQQPPHAPQGYTQPPRTQPVSYTQDRTGPPTRPPQAAPADPRYPGYQGYDPAGVPPTQPVRSYQPPQYAPAPQYAPQAATVPAYVPDTVSRTQPPQNRQSPAPGGWQGQPPQRPAAPAIDPHGYDLGNYMPAAAPEAADPRSQRPSAGPAAPAWSPYGEAAREQHYGQPVDYGQPLAAHDASFGQVLGQHAPDPHGALEPVADADEYEDDDYADAPQRTRYGLIAASLFGAIAVGVGLAVAYKTFVAPPAQIASTPVVKGNGAPAKVKPADTGGTKFADTGPNITSKMTESLSNSQPAAADGGPKAVQTYTVGRDGSIATPSAAGETPPSGGVPGMIIAGLPPPRAPTPAAAPPAAEPVVVQPPPVAVVKPAPRLAAAAPLRPAAAPEAAAVDAAPAPPPAKKPVTKKPPAATTAAAALGGPPATTGSAGFVAVLASVPASGSSRMAAMQQFADLQQKYPTVLGGKSPDVVEATVKNNPYHRLVVGPPGSRDAASSVCGQLKAAGYAADCWVTGF